MTTSFHLGSGDGPPPTPTGGIWARIETTGTDEAANILPVDLIGRAAEEAAVPAMVDEEEAEVFPVVVLEHLGGGGPSPPPVMVFSIIVASLIVIVPPVGGGDGSSRGVGSFLDVLDGVIHNVKDAVGTVLAMGTMAAEAGGLQPAGGDKVPIQMTANYMANSSGDLRLVEFSN